MIDATFQSMQGIGFSMVPNPAPVIAKQLVAAAVQSVTAFLAPVGFDSEHAHNKKMYQITRNE